MASVSTVLRFFALLFGAVGIAALLISSAMTWRLGYSLAMSPEGKLLFGGSYVLIGVYADAFACFSVVAFRFGSKLWGWVNGMFAFACALFKLRPSWASRSPSFTHLQARAL